MPTLIFATLECLRLSLVKTATPQDRKPVEATGRYQAVVNS
jgi:hypothetical protein